MASRVDVRPRERFGRCIVVVGLAVALLGSAGCAKQSSLSMGSAMVPAKPQRLVPNADASPDAQMEPPLALPPMQQEDDAQPVAATPPAAKKTATPADEPLLPGDPIANQAPMPMAKLKARAKARATQVASASARPMGLRGSLDVASGKAVGFLGVPILLASKDKWVPVDVVLPERHLPEDTIAVVEERDAYRLDAGDRVRVSVYGQPSLSRVYAIDATGTVAMPLAGSVRARGLTVSQLKARIAGALGAKYVRDPEVSVEIAQYRPFFILGEVRAPGQFAWVDGMTIQTAVAIAGGYSPRASERLVRLQRRVDGVLSEIDVPSSTAVKPGDTLYVYERFF
jgi:polysaccharide biosynthesis/export protein